MVPGDLLVQVPPHPLDRVAVRAVRRQEVQLDPIPVLPQVDRHRLARVELGVVADHVDLPVRAAAGAAGRPGAPGTGPSSRPCFGFPSVRKTCPVRQWIEPARYRFSLFPGVSTSACCPLTIHIEPILGLVLMSTSSWKTAVSSAGSSARSCAQFVQLGLPLLVVGPRMGRGPAVDQVAAMQPAADRLAADLDVVVAEHQRRRRPRSTSGCGGSRSRAGPSW